MYARALVAFTFAAAAAAEPAPQTEIRRYDIPSQSLDHALSKYARQSGVDVLLNQSVAVGRRSTRVAGRYSSPAALGVLLTDTGLVMRFTTPRSALVVAANAVAPGAARETARAARPALELDTMRVTAPRLIGRSPNAANQAFALNLATAIRRAIVDDGAVAGGPVTLRIRTRIDERGTLHDVQVVAPGAGSVNDRRIVAAIEGLRLGEAPPPDLMQPLVFDVRSR